MTDRPTIESYTMFRVSGWLVRFPDSFNRFPIFTTSRAKAEQYAKESR
jgi:hypothetical protein